MKSNYNTKPVNHMKEVAKMLGVDLNEEFRVTGKTNWKNTTYRITEERGMEEKWHHFWDKGFGLTTLNDILLGKRKVVKLGKR